VTDQKPGIYDGWAGGLLGLGLVLAWATMFYGGIYAVGRWRGWW
jgi:hypothetical protein